MPALPGCSATLDSFAATAPVWAILGERAVEITQVVAVAMTANMPVEQLAQIPLSFPAYTGMIGRAAQAASRQLAVKTSQQEESP